MSLDTLAGPVRHAVEIRHSRFLAQAAPVESAEAAARFLADASIGDASHNCWAWRVGGEYRSNDDGEPAGTAGRPILAAIDGQGFDRVAVVVTRWFGGVKLGAGGLVRAYGGAAAECLRLAPRRPLVETVLARVHLEFADVATLHQLLPAFAASKRDESFDARGAWIALELPAGHLDALKTRLRDATRDRARFEDQG
ncbi:IMPACT family protein [Luteimonas sp. M1R5S18]|uniref:IMPACT family protein n=1 Tax=Luteimonas rhizosphaericola TaxID=3042024 RepID=A0ABT6JHT3_9GAMM|nr:YigZ family protein [Luteimonas rhizosphaericola]MDH5830230.1 IMPACT family protein [Luteimonas rhizosphaericola]